MQRPPATPSSRAQRHAVRPALGKVQKESAWVKNIAGNLGDSGPARFQHTAGVSEKNDSSPLPGWGLPGAEAARWACFLGRIRQFLPAKGRFRWLSPCPAEAAKGLYWRVTSGGRKNILARSAVLRLQLRTETNSIRKPSQTTRGIHLRPECNVESIHIHVNRQGGPDNGQY